MAQSTTTADANKAKALDLALSSIEKQFGKGAIMKFDGTKSAEKVPAISTGCLGLDLCLGVGGVPKGRIIEIYGPESSGKTTLTLHIAAEAQKAGGTVAFVDAEHALDTSYAAKLGVDVPNTLISQPDSGEQALEITDMLVRSGAVDLLIVDSVAALTPRAELEGDMGDSHMGLQARLMSQALRKLTGSISRSNTTVIFINQLRMKIGVMFGNPETTTGGNALKFYASVRMDIRRIAAIKDGEKHIGNRTRVKIAKNKVAPPFGQVEFDIMYGEGISKTGDLLDLAVAHGFVEKAGAWFSYENNKMGQGRENSKQFLKDNPEIFDELKKKILAKNGLGSKEDMALYSGEVVDESTGEIMDEDLTEATTTTTTTKKTKKSKKTLQ
ncbi:MAG: recombinase RecA [Bdellovibrionales bacterium CG12_big_fil_rev_8_21_14_0_65_38_15]|nr:MAG: recombinase RecA [Bdellovibrionales bacterium CG22_combo_CG10-13_8_21_14_all_38_13]PIQ57347.1 MAG: recombinase RecA [Bdellovibrionales bacterium CG12_big_fil_rev_8_21_14_0_65_38_15]PIR28892.1 MAG: recombinase RecA [Bdellovibrionales bacterium CG11_big_fil_rev_8_21_14_0_20_38_13]